MRFLKWLAVLIPVFCFGQKMDSQLATQKTNTIVGKPYSPTNRASLDQAIFDSKFSRLENNGTSGTNTYTVSIPWVTSYTTGLWVQVYFNAASTTASTINISSLGAKSIKNLDGSAIASGDIKIGPYILYYDGTNFIKTNGAVAMLPVANGGTGTSSPSLVAGTNVTITGSWPNQTINSTASGGISGLSTDIIPIATGSTTIGNSLLKKLSTSSYYLDFNTNGDSQFQVSNSNTGSSATAILLAATGTTAFKLFAHNQNYSTPGLSEISNTAGDIQMTTNAGGNFSIVNANLKLLTAGNKLFISEGSNGSVGQTTLVSGTKAITITGTTTSSRCFVQLVSQGGTVTTTSDYACVCTSNTVTITALTNAGATVTLDTSTLNYWIIN